MHVVAIAGRIFLFLALPILLFNSVSGVVNAATPSACDLTAGSGALDIPTWYKYLPGEDYDGDCQIKDDLGGRVVILILMGIFDILLYLAGFLAVIFVIYGGFKFLTSNGEPDKIAAARTTLLNSLVGLGIAVLASQVIGFIARSLA